MKGLLDRALAVAIDRAAEPAGIRFTERQLYYELCRVLRPWSLFGRRARFTVAPAVSYSDFRSALARAGRVPGLLTADELWPRTKIPGVQAAEPDLFDYGLPRLLVCQRQEIAGMLRANDVPMESACPVFGPDELPLDPRLAAMLTRAGDAVIYVLHDADPTGLTFAGQITPPPGVRVVPLGLRPRQAASLHLVHGRGPARETVVAASGWERAWLAKGRFVEVAAVHPAALLRTVHRLVREVHRNRPQWSELRRVRDLGFLSWPSD